MKKQDAIKWINALRSGKYNEGHIFLRSQTDDSYYSCLGVLDKINRKLRLSKDSNVHLENYHKIGLESKHGDLSLLGKKTISIYDLNKRFDMNFDEIADIIQIYYVEGF